MIKARYTLTAVVEHEIDPRDYLGAANNLERMEQDIKGLNNYPAMILDMSGVKVNVTGELLPVEEDPNQASMFIENDVMTIPAYQMGD